MSRLNVEKAPLFDIRNLDFSKLDRELWDKYDVVDKKGRYLHWNQLKHKFPREKVNSIWEVIRLKRTLKMNSISLMDENDSLFEYFLPAPMEAKLHEIIRIAGAQVGAVNEEVASENIQQKYLVSSLIMEEAITSSQLEGAATTREVAKEMLKSKRDPINEDERMILNNYFLLKHAEETCKEDLTLELILNFHEIATQHTTENDVVPGELRKNNDIFVGDSEGGVAYQPPDFQVTEKRLKKLCEFANSKNLALEGRENTFTPPLIKAIILHFMIGYEHPFRDGNGRVARALFYWYMLKHDYNLFKYISISKLLKNKPKEYGLAYLYTEKDANDLTYFIGFQFDIILDAIEDFKNYLESKTQEFQQVMEILEKSKFKGLFNFSQKDLIKKAVKEPGSIFTARRVAYEYDISENTARKYLKLLVEKKLLLETKDGKTKLYLAPSNLIDQLN